MTVNNISAKLIVWFIIGSTQTVSLFARHTNQVGLHLNLTQTVYYDEAVSFHRFSHTGIHPFEIRFQHQGQRSRQTVSLYYRSERLEPVHADENSLQDFLDLSTACLELRYERKCRDCVSGRLEIWAGGSVKSSADWGERRFQKLYSGAYSAETFDMNYLAGWIQAACFYRSTSNSRLEVIAGIPVFSLHPRIYNSRLSVSEHSTVVKSGLSSRGFRAELAWSWSHHRWVFQTYYRLQYTRSHDPYLKKHRLSGLGTGVYYAF